MKTAVQRLSQSFDRLSAREQILVMVLVSAIALTFIGALGVWVKKGQAARERRIAAKVERLKEVASARGVYQQRLAEQNRLAEEVRGNSGTRILTYLEDLARRARIDLGNAAERAGEPTGSDLVREEAAEVLVRNVSIDRLHEFLKLIEEGNRLVVVRRLKINTRFDNKEMLDASVTVGTFKPAREG